MKNIPIFMGLIFALLAALVPVPACSSQPAAPPKPVNRVASIPQSIVKMTPETDLLPPKLHSNDYQKPVPLDAGVNTAGAEDSPFILPDGNTLYFFFTPDASVPPQKQLLDGVTGLWISWKSGGEWQPAERVWLQTPGELSLDGAAFVSGDNMWFASARKGNYRGVDLWTARYKDGRWQNFQNAGKKLNQDYEAGEMHITADGKEMYFHSGRAGGQGQYDIWVTRNVNGDWQSPEHVRALNTAENEGWPFVSQDGKELWFLRTYLGSPGLFRSKKSGSGWGPPELIVSQFAGEPTLDNAGNLYFVHHYVKDGKILEADIYVCYRK